MPASPTNPREDDVAYAIIGAAIEVHKALGPGYLEVVYEEAMAVEMTSQKIPFVRQATHRILYRDHNVGEGRVDFLVDGLIVVELKAVDVISPVHRAQITSYLNALGLNSGLIVNFREYPLKNGIVRVYR